MQTTSKTNATLQDVISLQVSNDLTVQVIPNNEHEFLMTTRDVATGYGIVEDTMRSVMSRNKDELVEGEHFIKGVAIRNTLPNIQPHQIFWTKAGVVRLGMFIKSERARLFRDWAEKIILKALQAPKPISLPPLNKRKHIRINPPQMVELLKDICQVEPKELRLSMLSKLQ